MAADISLGRHDTAADRTAFKCRRYCVPSFTVTVVAFFVIVSTLASCAAAEDGAPAPTIKPRRLTVEVGSTDLAVSCQFEDSTDRPPAGHRYLWVDSQSNPLDNTSSVFPRIAYNATTGELTLRDASENDTGEYTCYVLDYVNCTYSGDANDLKSCINSTFAYKVYVMPDYTNDGIIIGAINGALLLVFVACLIRSAVADRKRLRKYGQKL
jgi:hypothetical protein